MAGKDKQPAFPFYASDWLGSTNIALMTPEQEGAFIRLLAHEWADPDCSLPADDASLSVLSRLSNRWNKLKEPILKCFQDHPELPGRIANQRLLAIKNEKREYSKHAAENGRKGASKRWGGHSEHDGETIATPSKTDSQAIANCMAKHSFPSPSPINTNGQSNQIETHHSGEPVFDLKCLGKAHGVYLALIRKLAPESNQDRALLVKAALAVGLGTIPESIVVNAAAGVAAIKPANPFGYFRASIDKAWASSPDAVWKLRVPGPVRVQVIGGAA